MEARIAVLPGDGIGPEVIREAVLLLEDLGRLFGHQFQIDYGQIGGVAFDDTGSPLPEATVTLCQASDAVLLGAVGGPKWDHLGGKDRPEAGLLGLRKALSVFANLRPIEIWPELAKASPLKPEVLADTNLLIVRELTGGLYFGQPKERRQGPAGLEVVDSLVYTEAEMERLIRKGFQLAEHRRGKLTSVDKANVLESSRLWRETVNRIHAEYPQVEVNHMLVDTAAMQLVQNPRQFDVVVTENMFGDILSDEAAVITGSIGLLPSASLSAHGPGLFEPIHGSAPDIAGKNIANPLATFLSVAMLLRFSLGLTEEATAIEDGVRRVIEQGHRTRDIAERGGESIGTDEMGKLVRNLVRGGVKHAENAI